MVIFFFNKKFETREMSHNVIHQLICRNGSVYSARARCLSLSHHSGVFSHFLSFPFFIFLCALSDYHLLYFPILPLPFLLISLSAILLNYPSSIYYSHLYFPWKPLPIVFFRSISSILGIKVHHPTYNINH